MVTIKQIAEIAKVSTATVSNVINDTALVKEETRKKVLEVIKKLDYEPNSIAKSLKIRRTNTIGVITEDITVFSTNGIVNGIDEYFEHEGYSMLLNNIRLYKKIGNHLTDDERCSKEISEVTRDFIRRQVDGLIYIGFHCRDISGIIGNINIPIVYTYCYSKEPNTYSVIYDDEEAAYEALKYLISKQHKKIGLISGPMDSMHSIARCKGYQRAIYENKLDFKPSFIKVGDWTYEAGYLIGKEMLSSSDIPTAVFSMNDEMAYGFNDAAKELGYKIPEDISLIGFDDRDLSGYYIPKLTSVRIPLNDMGKRAAETLLKLIKNETINIDRISKLKCKLIERESVSSI